MTRRRTGRRRRRRTRTRSKTTRRKTGTRTRRGTRTEGWRQGRDWERREGGGGRQGNEEDKEDIEGEEEEDRIWARTGWGGGRQNQDYDMERATRTRRRAEMGKGRVEDEEDNWTRKRSAKQGGGGRQYFQLRTKTSFNRVFETWNRFSVDINFEAKSSKRISRSRKNPLLRHVSFLFNYLGKYFAIYLGSILLFLFFSLMSS